MGGIKPIPRERFDKFLKSVGCRLLRGKGDHRVYTRSGLKRPVVIPRKELPVFIIRNNLKLLNIDTKEYLKIIQKHDHRD